MDNLPHDVLYNIISRISIKSLMRLRCTCKKLYTEPFLEGYFKKLIEEPKILLASFPEKRGPGVKPMCEVEVGFLKASVPQVACPLGPDLLGYCNGLMCFRSDPGVIVLVNPLIEEVRTISTVPPPPPPDDRLNRRLDEIEFFPWVRARARQRRTDEHDNDWCATGLGLDYVIGTYKIVVISQSPLRAKMLVLGTRSWRKLNISNLGSTVPSGLGISIGASLYWLGSPYHRGWMVCFLVAKEKFSYLPCPSTQEGVMFDLGKRLGLAEFMPAGQISVWAFDVYRKAWDKAWDIDLSGWPLLLERCAKRVMGGLGFDILGTLGHKVVLRVDAALFSYDPRSCKIEPIRCPALKVNAMPYCLRGSLVSLSLFDFDN